MALILNEFCVFDSVPEKIKQNIKSFHVFKSDFAICVTNDDKVYAFGDKIFFKQYLGYENIDNYYLLISELCDENIEQFFYFEFNHCLFARSSDNRVFSSGWNKYGKLARSDQNGEYLKPGKIGFFDNKNIIDIKSGHLNETHCLALTSDGMVYNWGYESQTTSVSQTSGDKTPVLLNNRFGDGIRVKHINCFKQTSVLVSYKGFVYILNPTVYYTNSKLTKFIDQNIITLKAALSLENLANFIFDKKFLVLKNSPVIKFSSEEESKTIKINFESLVYSINHSNELIVKTEQGIQIIDKLNITVSQLNCVSTFEYCLFKDRSTFTTIHLKENTIYCKDIEINENSESLSQTLKPIEFNVEEFNNKFFNKEFSKNLWNFQLFNSLPQILESKVKYFFQIGRHYPIEYKSVIFVMYDQNVYGIGYNKKGILGLGHQRRVIEFASIEGLSDKNIQEFYEGGNKYTGFMFARNELNQIFGWGDNKYGQLARVPDGDLNECLKPLKIDFFDNKTIVDIGCGSHHCLALSEKGVVCGWGSNEYGQTGSRSKDEMDCMPIEIKLSDSSDRIKFIHCYENTSGAVTVDGTAYLWGEINGRKTVIPILIETDVSKMFITSDSKLSILTNDKIFEIRTIQLFEDIIDQDTIVESEGVVDICGPEVVLKEEVVYEVNEEKKELIKTNFSNFYEYFLYKKKRIIQTIQITSDGYLKRPIIKSNLNSNTKIFVNIFHKKFDKCFDRIDSLGEGGFGVVDKVKCRSTSALFAIKRIQIKGNFLETLREIKIMSQLKSEYIVKYYNSWSESKVNYQSVDNFMFIQMEMCSQNLDSIIELINDLSEEKKFKKFIYFIRSELFLGVIVCLNYLHSSNPAIMHRDLKPKNILVSEGLNKSFLKLCDFGLSKILVNNTNTSKLGTQKYMAPEVKGNFYNEMCDIFSGGVVATDIFNLVDIENMHENGVPEEYLRTELEPKVRQLFENICKMLSKEPNERLSCSELLAESSEWRVDPNIIRSDEYFKEFIEILEKDENLKIFKTFIESKFSTNY